MLNQLAAVAVMLAAIYLVALAGLAVASPERTKSFLGSFATSAFAHFLELSIRLILGAALILYAPRMRFSELIAALGWVVVVTTVALFVVPWRWHRRFAVWSVPIATRNLKLFALGSLVGGLFLLLSLVLGPAA